MKYLKMGAIIVLALAIALPSALSACAPAPTSPAAPSAAPESLKFGMAIAISGWLAPDAEGQYLTTKMWVEEVNAAGGIYVPEYDKKIPVKLIIYDDKSDPGTTLKMAEKLILDDKIDFLVAPFGTEWHFPLVPLTDKYKIPWIGDSVTSEQLRSDWAKYPYYFTMEAQWPQIGDALVEICKEAGVKSVAVTYFGVLYGVEGAGYKIPRLEVAGIDIKLVKSYPPDFTDLSPLAKEVKAANPDAVLSTCYVFDSLMWVEALMQTGFNPKLFCIDYPASEPALPGKFGKNMDGIMGQGGWDPDNPAVIAFEKRFLDRWGKPTSYLTNPQRWASLEILKQCIEKVGLDHEKVKDMLATETFHTALWGDVKFTNQYNLGGPYLNQWQGGKYVPIAPATWRKATPIYPKPAWK